MADETQPSIVIQEKGPQEVLMSSGDFFLSTSGSNTGKDNGVNTSNRLEMLSASSSIPCGQRVSTATTHQSTDQTTSASFEQNWDYNELPSQIPGTLPIVGTPGDIVVETGMTTQSTPAPKAVNNESNCTGTCNITLTPINATLDSLGKRSVLFIEFAADDSRELLANPFKINKLIYNNDDFKRLKIKDIRVNRKRNLIAIENENSLNNNIIEDLTSIHRLGEYNIRCYLPNSDIFVLGVIKPISIDVDLNELKQTIIIENDIDVVGVERMKSKDRDNNWIDSHAIKLKIKSNTLPASIFNYKWKFLLDRYTAVPM